MYELPYNALTRRFFFLLLMLSVLYNIALYFKVQKLDTKINKEPRVY